MARWLALVAIVHSLLERGSYLVIFLILISAGLGAPVAEELVVLSAGALSRQGLTRWWISLVVCWIGVLAGDLILFLVSRKLGETAMRHPRFRRLLPPERRKQLERFYRQRGRLAIFVGRQIPGVRAPLFALAGINRMDPRRFLIWDALAACVNTPAIFFLGWAFSDQLERVQRRFTNVEHWLLLLLVAGFAIWVTVSYWRSSHGHPVRRWRACLRRRRIRKHRRRSAR